MDCHAQSNIDTKSHKKKCHKKWKDHKWRARKKNTPSKRNREQNDKKAAQMKKKNATSTTIEHMHIKTHTKYIIYCNNSAYGLR